MIRIRAKRHNFRRCGIAHPKDPMTYPDDRFSAKELKILKAETMLIVEVFQTGDSKLKTRIAEETASDRGDLVFAAKAAIAAGKVTRDGKPLVEAMEEILGRDITAADRDRTWEKLATD